MLRLVLAAQVQIDRREPLPGSAIMLPLMIGGCLVALSLLRHWVG